MWRSLPPYCPYLATCNILHNKVNANYNGQSSETELLPLPAGNYGKSTKRSTQRRHHANESKSGMEAERVRALGGLRSLRSKWKLVVEKCRETNFLSHEETEKLIQDHVERETAGARKRVEDAEAAVQQEQDDTRKAENARLMNREPEMIFQEIMVAIRDSLSILASSDNGEDCEDEDDEEIEQDQLSENDKPGWVMGTINKPVQQRMESFRQKQMKLDELTQPAREDAAEYFRETDKKYSTTKSRVWAVVEPHTDDYEAAPAPTTIGELKKYLDIVRGI